MGQLVFNICTSVNWKEDEDVIVDHVESDNKVFSNFRSSQKLEIDFLDIEGIKNGILFPPRVFVFPTKSGKGDIVKLMVVDLKTGKIIQEIQEFNAEVTNLCKFSKNSFFVGGKYFWLSYLTNGKSLNSGILECNSFKNRFEKKYSKQIWGKFGRSKYIANDEDVNNKKIHRVVKLLEDKILVISTEKKFSYGLYDIRIIDPKSNEIKTLGVKDLTDEFCGVAISRSMSPVFYVSSEFYDKKCKIYSRAIFGVNYEKYKSKKIIQIAEYEKGKCGVRNLNCFVDSKGRDLLFCGGNENYYIYNVFPGERLFSFNLENANDITWLFCDRFFGVCNWRNLKYSIHYFNETTSDVEKIFEENVIIRSTPQKSIFREINLFLIDSNEGSFVLGLCSEGYLSLVDVTFDCEEKVVGIGRKK